MFLNAIKCPHCGDTVYSRVREDLRYCSCKYVWISGGTVCTRRGYTVGNPKERFISVQVQVDTNFTDLFTDWNRGIDRLGIIKEKDNV